MSDSSQKDESTRLEVRKVGKQFPGVRALHEVDLDLRRGEVLALIGENGAGKSTLMKILAGIQPPDDGEIRVEGRPMETFSVQAAMDFGISLIHQELNLADNLDVGANVFLGREPLKNGLINKSLIREESRKYLQMVGLDVDPDTLVRSLSLGRQQMVEIAKALSVDSRILIMDEPTSSLSQTEAESLFKVIKDLRQRGVSIIYISHRLSEVRELADRVVVLRDGENAGNLGLDEINHDNMVRLMVGRDISSHFQRASQKPGDVIFEVKGLRTPANPLRELGFNLRSGEIVGVAGLVGAGRTEVLETLFGVAPSLGGEVRIRDSIVKLATPQSAIDAGIALVPEDRKSQGLVIEMTVRENLSLAALKRDSRAVGLLDFAKELAISTDMIDRMGVRTPGDRQIIRYLSGGNQQKVVLGKWLAMEPGILLLDEPTRGIDVGAKREIYNLMEELAAKGVAILFVSSEMEEILGMADRAIVMHEGRITGELLRDQLSEEAIMQLATGQVAA